MRGSRGNDLQREITRGSKFLKSDHKAKGRSRGGTTKDGEFLPVTGQEKEIPRDTGLTRVPRLASHLLCPRSCFFSNSFREFIVTVTSLTV